MEKITEDSSSITKKLLSPNDEHEKVGTDIATTEGAEEGIEQSFKRVERKTIFFIHEEVSDSIQEPTVENHNEGFSDSGIMSLKRKLSEGFISKPISNGRSNPTDEDEGAIEKINSKCSLPNDLAAQKNDFTVDAKRAKFDLNVPIIDEDEVTHDSAKLWLPYS
ncbi:hypothetical protein Lal_00040075 [Lupinus albus]|nr:hypothetical protein Lal_00040075 [Lupinus albus]